MKEHRLHGTAQIRRWLLLVIAGLCIGLAMTGCLQQAKAAQNGNGEAAAKEGARIYQTNCSVCHGDKGDRVPVAPISSKEFLDSRGDATLVVVISEGKGVMPAWGKARGGPLTDEQVRAVVAYLNVSAGRSSSTLLAGQGKSIYMQQCSNCHGEKGDRIPVSPLSAKAFMDSRTDGQLFEAIAEGKGVMPGYRKGAKTPKVDEEVKAIVSYLRFNAESSLAEQARRGRELYVSNCLACHGERGDRVPNIGLASSDYLSKLGDGALITSIVEGKGVMPGFSRSKGGSFEVPEIAALMVYMKSWAGLPAGSALTGAEMPSQGRDLFARNCTGCHGDSGDKVAGVRLKSRDFLDGRPDDALVRSIVQGNARGMPAWGRAGGGPLEDAAIRGIVQYLRAVAVGGPAAASGAPAAPAAPAAAPTAAPAAAPAAAAAAPAAAAPAATAGDPTKGKATFTASCVACHGETRDKIPTCKLADGAWLKEKGDATLAASIANGKGAMPSWGKAKGGPLSDDDIKNVVAYLKKEAGVVDAAAAPAAAAAAPAAAAPAAAAAAPAAPAAAAAPAATAGDPTKGRATFTATCVACHGETRDKIPTCKLADGAWLKEKGDATLAASITNGKGAMPSWGKAKGGSLSDEDITNVIAYLKKEAGVADTAAAPTAAAAGAAAATAGDPTKGKVTFTSTCVACHGETRDKIPTCKLADGAWLKEKGDATLAASIANGKGAMPSWGKAKGGPLSDDDITNVVAYLKKEAGVADAGGGGTTAASSAADAAAKAQAEADKKDPTKPAVEVSPVSGRAVFKNNCVFCHGEDGMKQPNCPLGLAAWLGNISDDGLRARIAGGKPGAGMPAWSKARGGSLSESQIQAVMAYLPVLAQENAKKKAAQN